MGKLLTAITSESPAVARPIDHDPQFDLMLFLGFLGMLMTLTAWFARHVPKSERPLAIPVVAFTGVLIVCASLWSGGALFAALVLAAVALKEFVEIKRFLKTRAATRRRSVARRWSLDPSRHERLFGDDPAARPARRSRYSHDHNAPLIRDDDTDADPVAH